MDPSPNSHHVNENSIASRRVLELLWDKHLANQANERLRFYNLFLGSPQSAIAAGWLFKLEIHRVLRQRQTIKLFPVRSKHAITNTHYHEYSASSEGGGAIELQLPGSDEYGLEAAGKDLLVGRYYRPRTQNLATADSLYLLNHPTKLRTILLISKLRGTRANTT